MRLTKIVCTLGPATGTPEKIEKLIAAGMNVARINFSHGDRESHAKTIAMVKDANAKTGAAVAIMLDTKGAEIRTGERREPLSVQTGEEVVFSPVELPKEKRSVILVNHDGFAGDVRETNRILLDNGEIIFDIVSIDPAGFVVGRATGDGTIGSRRHVNLPGADIDLPSVTEKDWADIAFGIEQGMDAVALSFIRTAEEVQEVRDFLKDKDSDMLIITKIETQQAVENIQDIIRVSDGIMVARGDLGAEIPFERIPAIQDKLVEQCRAVSKPVIVATHMLESMIQHPIPTRAEVTDIAHAATTRTDCTMLSGETAGGKFPFLAVDAMERILRETEGVLPPLVESACALDEYQARAEAAIAMATSLHAAAILVITRSGTTARAVSHFRPLVPIFAATESDAIRRRMQFMYGVRSVRIPFSSDFEETTQSALQAMVSAGLLHAGNRIVLISDMRLPGGAIGTVQIRTVQ